MTSMNDHTSKFRGFQRLHKEGVKNAADTAARLTTYAANILDDIGYEGDVKWAERPLAATESAIPHDAYKNLAIDKDGKVSGSFIIPIADGVELPLPISMNRSYLGPKSANGWIATVGGSEPYEITSDEQRVRFLDAASGAIEKAIRELTSFPKLG